MLALCTGRQRRHIGESVTRSVEDVVGSTGPNNLGSSSTKVSQVLTREIWVFFGKSFRDGELSSGPHIHPVTAIPTSRVVFSVIQRTGQARGHVWRPTFNE